MTGNRRARIVVQERDRDFLRELATHRIVDREQAKCIAGFRSTTRVNARLLALHRAGLLRRYFIGTDCGGVKALYALSEKGARLVDVPYRGLRRRQDEVLVADFSVVHQLSINSVYCAWKCGSGSANRMSIARWLTFTDSISRKADLIPDAYAELVLPAEKVSTFLEVDLGHEGLAILKEKAKRYLDFAISGDYERTFHEKRFRVLVLARSEQRARSIQKAVSVVTNKLFWFGTLANAMDGGVASSLWFRPGKEEPEPFLRPIL